VPGVLIGTTARIVMTKDRHQVALQFILLFDPRAEHSSVPTATIRAVARSGGQGWPLFAATASAARSVLDGREHDGTLPRVGARR